MSVSETGDFCVNRVSAKATLQQTDSHPNDEGKECGLFPALASAGDFSGWQMAKDRPYGE
jgi:hypothetical protein